MPKIHTFTQTYNKLPNNNNNNEQISNIQKKKEEKKTFIKANR